jgi:hydroxyquinol 1,2-dioxygenase
MRHSVEADLTEAVLARLAPGAAPRFKQVMTSLVQHLHAFVREVELTEEEWFEGIRFLTAAGQKSDDKRQEFILLSDVLGVSMLVDAINHRAPQGATESTVLGPFFVEGAPVYENGTDLTRDLELAGEPTWVTGRVRSVEGKPIAGAMVDVWQARPDSLYDVQDADAGLELRGRFRSDAEGRFWYRTYKPVSYPVPTDGPVGRLLDAMGRHPMRPAHIHFIIAAPGYEQLVTHLFAAGDEYLDSDAVFGVKESLIARFEHVESAAEARRLGMPSPFLRLDFDFRLAPASGARTRAPVTAGDAAER